MDDLLREALGSALGCQYDVLRLLGRGAMGAVYLARERSLERLVAIKVLPPSAFNTPESRERFRREARIAARLAHPHILPLHTFGEVGELDYYVMGYVHGESLAKTLEVQGALTATEARRILRELADALDFAHRQGVIHRDIKPANVLIEDESGRALLADFGVAKSRESDDGLTYTGVALGTPMYMSPEQAAGSRDVDGRSDIYSLGVLAYTMLAGREPFSAASVQEIVYKHLTEPPPLLRTLVPDVPEDLEAAVMRCLAKDPAERWPDGRSLNATLTHDGGVESSTAPELRELAGFGTWAALWAAVWGAMAALGDGRGAVLAAFLSLLVPVGLVFHVWSIRRKGLRVRQLLRASFWPPKWWGMWWPRSLRRPGDLWRRLPRGARIARAVMTAVIVVGVALALASARADSGTRLGGALSSAATVAVPLASFFAVVTLALWWGRRRGLTTAENFWLLFGPTAASALWSTPQVDRLLTPLDPSGGRAGSRPRTPRDLLHAISQLVSSLAGASREAGAEATSVARQIVGCIGELDAEIASLGRDASPAEIARLEERLTGLGGEGAGPAAEHAEMRRLLASQLELMRRLRTQHEIASHRRAHLTDLLQALWGVLAEREPVGTSDAAGAVRGHATKVHELCAAIRAQVDQDGPSVADEPSDPAPRNSPVNNPPEARAS